MTRLEFRPPDTDLTVWDPIPLDQDSPGLPPPPVGSVEDAFAPAFDFTAQVDLPVATLLSVDQTDVGL